MSKVQLFGRRRQSRHYGSAFIYDTEQNILVGIPRYDFAEVLKHYLRGAFAENPALKTVWEKEPLRDIRKTVWGHSKYDIKRPRAMELISEAVEYYVLNKLSIHLTDYFSDKSFRETNLQKYNRQDIPEVLLSNRFLELFSRPMINRPRFVGQALGTQNNESASVWNEDGTIYDSFDLILPKKSEVRRPQPYTIEISTARMVLLIETKFEGFSANFPRGFAKLYLGITESENEEFFMKFMGLKVHINVTGVCKGWGEK